MFVWMYYDRLKKPKCFLKAAEIKKINTGMTELFIKTTLKGKIGKLRVNMLI